MSDTIALQAIAVARAPARPSERFLFVLSKRNPSGSNQTAFGCLARPKGPRRDKMSSLMVNELPHRRPCVCFASLAALTGNRRGRPDNYPLVPRPKGAMHGFGGNRHSPIGMTTLQTLPRFEKARYASRRSLAFFLGAPLPFLWARPKKWGGKGFYKGLPLFCPAARSAAL